MKLTSVRYFQTSTSSLPQACGWDWLGRTGVVKLHCFACCVESIHPTREKFKLRLICASYISIRTVNLTANRLYAEHSRRIAIRSSIRIAWFTLHPGPTDFFSPANN